MAVDFLFGGRRGIAVYVARPNRCPVKKFILFDVVGGLLLLGVLTGCTGDSGTQLQPPAPTDLSISPAAATLPFFGDTVSFSYSITD